MKDNRRAQAALPQWDEYFLSERLEESRAVVREVVEKSGKPIIIQFSGGRDSMALVGLVREVTDRFICFYMVSGIEFEESIEFVGDVTRKFGWTIMFSQPELYKGGFFERLVRFRYWPTIKKLWCQRDLKVRPQHIALVSALGDGQYYKLNGVRKYESTRRKYLYPRGGFIRRDDNSGGHDFEVFPILHWTDSDVETYLKMVSLPTSGLYKKYGVSGCYWCPWYQKQLYATIIKKMPNLYDKFIMWEEFLGQPSVIGDIYLRDIKQEVLYDRP